MMNLLAFQMPGFDEWIVIAIIGVIVFGRKLPEVGKNLGRGIVEFKKGLKGIDEEVERESSKPSTTVRTSTPVLPQSTAGTTVPAEGFKFDPVTGAPLQDAAPIPAGAKFDPFTGKPLETSPPDSGSIGIA
jgi:sec-independent protein translocase protein TatA